MNFRLTSLFVFLFLSVQLWAGGHKNLPAKGDLYVSLLIRILIIITGRMSQVYTIWSMGVSS